FYSHVLLSYYSVPTRRSSDLISRIGSLDYLHDLFTKHSIPSLSQRILILAPARFSCLRSGQNLFPGDSGGSAPSCGSLSEETSAALHSCSPGAAFHISVLFHSMRRHRSRRRPNARPHSSAAALSSSDSIF